MDDINSLVAVIKPKNVDIKSKKDGKKSFAVDIKSKGGGVKSFGGEIKSRVVVVEFSMVVIKFPGVGKNFVRLLLKH